MGFCKDKEGIKVKGDSKIGHFCHLNPASHIISPWPLGARQSSNFASTPSFWGLPPVLCMGLLVEITLTCVFHRGNKVKVKARHGLWASFPPQVISVPATGVPFVLADHLFKACRPAKVSKLQGNPPSLMQEHDSEQVVKLLHKYAKHILYNSKDSFVLSVRLHVLKA